eukprot:TRINITY_DN10213_c0_g3_i1.p1 TRINITY_DN10213_c0_g3~~TRINITY_DN10213_c0_g3_i1.p1  ORF type:complete len:642 (+),score=74.50 TRINITY_DN10213_c0_g3_i1:207-2132(+)
MQLVHLLLLLQFAPTFPYRLMDDRSIHSAGHASHGPLKQMLKNALGSDTAADLSRVLKNEQDDFTTILYTLQFSFAACLLMVVVFVCIRALFPQAHVRDADEQEKSYSHAASSDYTTTAMESSGIFETAWVWWSVNVSAIEERRLIELLGLDGVMMLESLQMGKKITCLLACALIPLLCPLYYFYYQRGDDASKSSLLSIISVDTFTASTTSQGQTVLSWALAACAWLVVLVVTYVLDYHQQIFLARRFDWLRRMPYPRATTLLVENIPPELRSDQALKLYFCRLFSDESIESAYIVRKTNTLRRWVENERKLDIQLKEATLAWEAVDRDPSRRPRVGFWNSEDAIELYTRKLEEASSLVDKRRQDLDQAVEAMDLNVCSSTGFVTFYSRRLCTLASRQQYRTDINEMVITDPPDTNDVNYDDLMQHTHVQLGRRVLTQMLLFTLFMIWAPMIITVQSFTGLEAFKRVFPWLDSLCEMYPTLEHLLEGVMSTAALSGFMYLLPIGLMLIFRSLLPLKAGTWAQLKLQEVLFIFQILFVVIMTSVAGSVFGSLGRFIDDPKDVLTVLCLTLPTYYGFYIQFFMMACNLRFVSTLRSWQVTLFMFSRFILGRSPQLAKQDCEPEDQDTDGMGAALLLFVPCGF